MIIFFGTGSSGVKYSGCETTCPKCNTPDSVGIVYRQKYFHIFWIPFFPLNKYYGGYCGSCKESFAQSEIAIPIEARKQATTPKWTFAGLIIIAAIIISATVSNAITSHRSKEKMETITSNPTVGDIYEVVFTETDPKTTISNQEYTLFKVVSITTDSIYLINHKQVTHKKSHLYKLEDDNFYTDEEHIFGLPKDLIDTLVKDGMIFNIR